MFKIHKIVSSNALSRQVGAIRAVSSAKFSTSGTPEQPSFHESSSNWKWNSNKESGQRSFNNFMIFGLMGLAAVDQYLKYKKSECCGIVGVIGEDNAAEFLLEGLQILRNRGYDSAGIATVAEKDSNIAITKYASRDTTSDSIDLVRKNVHKHLGHTTGIAHTRWATHGGKTDVNAHPHTDRLNRIALIHNGTINNSHELKKELQDAGIKFKSETDTEVIAQLIGTFLDKGDSTRDAVSHALAR